MKIRTKPYAFLMKPTVFTFIIYNIIYSFYMSGFLKQSVYYGALLVFCIVGSAEICIKNSFVLPISKMKFFDEAKVFVFISFSFLIISLTMQMINGNFGLYTEKKLILFLMPVIIVFILANATDLKYHDTLVFIIFIRMCLQFLLSFGSGLSIQAILQINWFDTSSSLFESSLAHDFCLITIYYLFSNNKKMAAISTFFCILSFKRLSILVCLLSWGICRFVPSKGFNRKKVLLGSSIFIVLTVLTHFLYSDVGVNFLYDKFNFDLNRFTTSRVGLVNMVTNHFDGAYTGFGSISNYFDSLGARWSQIGMHCDILKIFYETTAFGSFIFIYGLLSICKKDYRILYMFLYFIGEMIVSQFIELVNCWVIFFLFILKISYQQENRALCKTDFGKKV